MAIIVSKNGKNAEKVEPSAFRDEAHLQAYILQNPESLPLYEIDEDIRLLVAAREFSTNSGHIDALGIDADGQIYVIETKLYKNPDKRLVLAQVLDYGAALWRHHAGFGEFMDHLEEQAQRQFGVPFRQKARDFFGITEDELTRLLDGTRSCLNDGRLRFVVLMDHLDDRLKDLIIFVNQNSQFSLYGVELEYYKHEDYEILIPRLFGAEVIPSPRVTQRRKWDEASFLDQARKTLSAEQLEAVQQLLAFSKERCEDMGWGTGAQTGSFSPKFPSISAKSIFTVYSDGKLILNFPWLNDSDSAVAFAKGFGQRVQELEGFDLPDSYLERFVRIPTEGWASEVARFTHLIAAMMVE